MGDYNPGQWCINPWWTFHGRLQPGAMVHLSTEWTSHGRLQPRAMVHLSMVDLSWEITTRVNGASIHGGPLLGDYNPGQWCIYPLSGHLMGDYNPGQWCINPWSTSHGRLQPGAMVHLSTEWTSHGRLQSGAMVHQSMVDLSWEITTRVNGASIHGGPLMGDYNGASIHGRPLMGDYNPGQWCIYPWWTSHGRLQPGAMVHLSMVDISWEIQPGSMVHQSMGDYNPGQWCINPWEITTRGNGASIHGRLQPRVIGASIHGRLQPGAMVHQSMGDYNPGQWCINPWEITTRGNGASIH
ncbi:hypothetical protein DPMN_142045 [Dreissena polymorpha]|uniref:Uncharacterized protein n=1 Tax=Dreissena polymorpha TaxID=45954 RepID=A0A9D4GDH4_DREPO|nr:hypothetical protein DPMN_142045 [Dreissena polymorpha]